MDRNIKYVTSSFCHFPFPTLAPQYTFLSPVCVPLYFSLSRSFVRSLFIRFMCFLSRYSGFGRWHFFLCQIQSQFLWSLSARLWLFSAFFVKGFSRANNRPNLMENTASEKLLFLQIRAIGTKKQYFTRSISFSNTDLLGLFHISDKIRARSPMADLIVQWTSTTIRFDLLTT